MKRAKHIFIVEDNQVYSMMLDYTLSKDHMYRFVSFNTGEQCLENLYLDPDIITLDHGLPGMSGYETLCEIKKRKPHIHVVILTCNADPELAAKLRAAGADDVVQKQGRGELQLIAKIESILEGVEPEKKKGKNKGYSQLVAYAAGWLVLLAMGMYFCY